MPKALVIGAGPAGTTTAIALHRIGWDVEVHEAYAHSSGLAQGVFLTVAVNGLDALAAMGADDAARDLGFPTGSIRFLSGTGRDLGAMPIGPVRADGTRTRTVRRADLYAALSGRARALGIPVHHGRRLRGAEPRGDAVAATFEDGATVTADLLVGADGLHSTVRSLIDPGAPAPRYTGLGNVGAFTRPGDVDVRAEAADGDYRMIWGRRCFFGYTVSPDGEVWWFANPPARAPLTRKELGDQDRRRAELVTLLAADAGPAAAFVRGTPGPVLFANQYDLPRVPAWHRGRMVLVGDAAHAVSPATGQGVSLAWEDAAALAAALAAEDRVGAALARYEAARRPRVDRITKWGARMGTAKAVGPVGRAVRDRMMPLVLARAARPAALARQAWLFDHRAAPLPEAVPSH